LLKFQARVWGTAYKIRGRDIEGVVQQLDLREVMGYERVPIEFHPVAEHPLNEFDVKPQDNYASSNDCSGFSTSNSFISSLDMDIDDDRGLLNSVGSNSNGSSLHGESESDSGLSGDTESKSETDTEYETEDSASDDDDSDPHYEDVKFGRAFRAIMYFGSEQNEHYVGPAPALEMAKQIYDCAGFSGKNIDYLLNLCNSMREICDEALDSHLRELESLVLSFRDQDTKGYINSTSVQQVTGSYASDSPQTFAGL
jgi:cation transport regulator ChaC